MGKSIENQRFQKLACKRGFSLKRVPEAVRVKILTFIVIFVKIYKIWCEALSLFSVILWQKCRSDLPAQMYIFCQIFAMTKNILFLISKSKVWCI